MRLALALALCLLLGPGAAAAGDDDLAKFAFGREQTPSPQAPAAIGSYSRGCLAGAVALPADGPSFQAMRLSRNRRYGHPALVGFVKELAAAAPVLGLRGLLVGDLSQPRGGPMLSGHSSHQIGLDADIWFADMPEPRLSEEERETVPFLSMLNADSSAVAPEKFTAPFARLLRHAARDERVARIFVHPLLKRSLCAWETPTADRAWLGKIRPWYGHYKHFHVRLDCPRGARWCRGQRPPPAGDGCGAPLDYWFTDAPYTPRPGARKKLPLTMARMPRACRNVLSAVLPVPRPPRPAPPDN
ncbi:penicillin-insensitive murein endopeptidase [Acuticoccus sp. MNP-M23]|uniref:penicillin-insensitive murein endopeptidase n=1 Tax=Acuticoccus sp. MNP-M23 TaxID=3072793 RepID=UPI0028159945|nr:penicillin-insensitive murein endopeptidase [Acuticoccus sp. MNP-M23]WMS44067.1 penicillin-insensitive murein endopeptidase [Acuticoccus sp. MNP-M23]